MIDVPGATTGEAFGETTVDVPAEQWLPALRAARGAGLVFLDFVTVVDEAESGFSVVAHVADAGLRSRLLLRTLVPRDRAEVPSATAVYPGAAWHEREAAELFGVTFVGHPDPRPLLLSPDADPPHPVAPLRKDHLLPSRQVTPWPGSHEPAEDASPARRPRRPVLPPGVAP